MTAIVEILCKRDGLSLDEAQAQVDDAILSLWEYLEDDRFEDANNICEEAFGLEPDYLEELL